MDDKERKEFVDKQGTFEERSERVKRQWKKQKQLNYAGADNA